MYISRKIASIYSSLQWVPWFPVQARCLMLTHAYNAHAYKVIPCRVRPEGAGFTIGETPRSYPSLDCKCQYKSLLNHHAWMSMALHLESWINLVRDWFTRSLLSNSELWYEEDYKLTPGSNTPEKTNGCPHLLTVKVPLLRWQRSKQSFKKYQQCALPIHIPEIILS
jgi:hypothetical protein